MSQLSKPVFKEDYLDIIREEKNGYWLVISKDHPEARELLLNKTSKEIIDYCDGTKTINEIISLMKSKYPLVPHEKLEKDINRTLAITSRLGLTKWIGENPFILDREEPIDEEYSIRIGNEEDLCSIYSFLKKSQVLFNQRNPLSDEHLYYKSKVTIQVVSS